MEPKSNEMHPITKIEFYFSIFWPIMVILVFLPSTSFFDHSDNPLTGNTGGGDYLIFWFAGIETGLGRALELYDMAKLKASIIQNVGAGFKDATWLYPPHILFVYTGLSKLSYALGWLVFCAVTVVAYLLVVAKNFPIKSRMVLLCAVSPATFICLMQGQTGLLVSALLLGAFLLLPTRPVIAGILFGCLTIKPQLGLLVPFILIFERKFLTFAVAGLTTIALIAASALWLGVDVWKQYFTGMLEGSSTALMEHIASQSAGTMMTVYGFITALGAGHQIALAVQGAMALLCLIAAYLVARSHINVASKMATYILLSYLVSPYIMHYDFPAATVIAAMVICRLNAPSYSVVERLFAYAVFALPFIHVVAEYLFMPFAVLFLIGFTGLMVFRCVRFSKDSMVGIGKTGPVQV